MRERATRAPMAAPASGQQCFGLTVPTDQSPCGARHKETSAVGVGRGLHECLSGRPRIEATRKHHTSISSHEKMTAGWEARRLTDRA
jgi:hypothetical protein